MYNLSYAHIVYLRINFAWKIKLACFMFSRQQRSVFTKLRISAHPLMIEKGRHFHPKIPVDQRIFERG